MLNQGAIIDIVHFSSWFEDFSTAIYLDFESVCTFLKVHFILTLAAALFRLEAIDFATCWSGSLFTRFQKHSMVPADRFHRLYLNFTTLRSSQTVCDEIFEIWLKISDKSRFVPTTLQLLPIPLVNVTSYKIAPQQRKRS